MENTTNCVPVSFPVWPSTPSQSYLERKLGVPTDTGWAEFEHAGTIEGRRAIRLDPWIEQGCGAAVTNSQTVSFNGIVNLGLYDIVSFSYGTANELVTSVSLPQDLTRRYRVRLEVPQWTLVDVRSGWRSRWVPLFGSAGPWQAIASTEVAVDAAPRDAGSGNYRVEEACCMGL